MKSWDRHYSHDIDHYDHQPPATRDPYHDHEELTNPHFADTYPHGTYEPIYGYGHEYDHEYHEHEHYKPLHQMNEEVLNKTLGNLERNGEKLRQEKIKKA